LEFIEDAKHGVIYFSFGSIVSMSSLPENVQSAFREALSRVPQKVLWKYNGEIKNKPKNVLTRKWFPQRDILCTRRVTDIIPYSYYILILDHNIVYKIIILIQTYLLVHPNVKLFISHGGISGVCEAVDAGVPVLGFPFFYDQPRNVDNLAVAGMAISMDLLSVTEKTLFNAVSELVNNDK